MPIRAVKRQPLPIFPARRSGRVPRQVDKRYEFSEQVEVIGLADIAGAL